MNLALWNFTAWCVQVAIVVAAGAALPFLFRLRSHRARLVYWHVLLAGCIALPFVQPWRARPVAVASNVSISMGPAGIVDSGASAAFPWSAAEAAAAVLAAGAVLRLLWLALGLVRLRRFRRTSEQVLPLPDDTRRLMHRLGVHADVYVSDDVTSPVTFGARNPVILLPVSFLDLPPGKREPVVFHELLHIQRSDWLFAIAEEVVRALLWFHPAVWWLIGRIHLTREQVVDQAVIEHTQSPDEYVDALIAIAATRLEADLAPAPLFLRKRHLHQRVAALMKEVTMSKRKLLLSSFAVFSALPLVVGITAWQFPLNAAPQEVRDAEGVEVLAGSYKVLHRAAVAFPAEARAKGISGDVVVNVTVNARGDVTDARIVSGPEALRKAALESVLNWHFDTTAPVTYDISLRFTAKPVQARSHENPPQADRKSLPVERVDLSRLPKALQERVAAANLVREGEIMSSGRLLETTAALKSIDEHLNLTASAREDRLTIRPVLEQPNQQQPVVQAASGSSLPAGTLRIGGNQQAAKLTKKITPVYPPLAKQARIQGTVRMNVTIDKQGRVMNIELLSGHPLLAPAAVEAVQQWEYQPTLLNGNPVDILTVVDINFTLAEEPPPAPLPPPQQ